MNRSLRLIGAVIIALISLVTYYCNRSTNPVTGEQQHVSMTAEQEIALGLQAAPEMAQQYGGLSQNTEAAQRIEQIGQSIVAKTAASKSPYRFAFHLLADPNTVNAFALPGGQVFITEGILRQLKSEAELAGVLGHEIGHVVGRHSAEQVAKSQLTQGLSGAAAIAAYDPDRPGTAAAAAGAAIVAKLVTLRFGREDELEADRMAVRFTADAGYDPRAMLAVMQTLERVGGGGGGPDFLQTHPNPGNRIQAIEEAIKQEFPQGIPTGLKM